MVKPKPYPPTDSAEQEAVTVFLGLIDQRIVKADIRIRDKYPNTDGTLELVDKQQLSLGKLEVQIRKINQRAKKYSCGAELVGYSGVSILPVILICVDTSVKVAYWKRISPTMPEYKENQKTFTIHFSEDSDVIDNKEIYIQKWIDIVDDHRKRIAKFPSMSKEIANKIKLEGLSPLDKKLFQQFTDSVNNLLDNQFISVKKSAFPDAWKLGVGIIGIDQEWLHYQIYKISFGEPYPLVCRLEERSILAEEYDPNVISEISESRTHFVNPTEAGERFVLKHVEEMVEKADFSVHGQMIATDVLFAFVDRYYRCLDIKPELDHYLVQDLNYALNQYLIQICAAVATKVMQDEKGSLFLDLDWLSRYLDDTDVEPIALSGGKANFIIGSSRWFPDRLAFDSLRYLLANRISEISRPFARRSMPPSPGGRRIWEGYTRDEEITSIKRILYSSINEYSEFVKGNHLRFPNSPYLNSDTSIVFEYIPVGIKDYGPGLDEHHISNSQRTLPKVSVFVKDEGDHKIDTSAFPIVKINGNQYESNLSSHGIASLFFRDTPVLNLIYRMLTRDLSAHYKLSITAPEF